MLGVIVWYRYFDIQVFVLIIIESMQKIELIKVRVDLTNSNTFPKGFVDIGALNLVTESQILVHEGEDDLEWEMLNKSSPKPTIDKAFS